MEIIMEITAAVIMIFLVDFNYVFLRLYCTIWFYVFFLRRVRFVDNFIKVGFQCVVVWDFRVKDYIID